MKLLIVVCLSFSLNASAGLTQKAAKDIWAQATNAKDTRTAIPLLQKLLDDDSEAVDHDLVLLTAGRLMYQEGRLDSALKYYSMVTKRSDFWIDAIEEKAMTYAKLGRYDKALAELKTVMAPIFSTQSSAESFFLQGLINLKICDYPAVFKSIENFKSRFRDRIASLTSLEKSGSNAYSIAAFEKLQKDADSSWASFSTSMGHLPRLFNRDSQLQNAAAVKKPALAQERFKSLAKQELEEISSIVRKFQILEIEATQRLHSIKPTKMTKKPSRTADQLVFPDEKEVWLDEITHYQVQASSCEPVKGKAL